MDGDDEDMPVSVDAWGDWVVEIGWAEREGGMEPIELRVRLADPSAKAAYLTGKVLRDLSVAELVRRNRSWAGRLRVRAVDSVSGRARAMPGWDAREREAKVLWQSARKARGRPPLTNDFYAQVAQVYLKAKAEGKGVERAVAERIVQGTGEEWYLVRDRARRAIREARKRGLLDGAAPKTAK